MLIQSYKYGRGILRARSLMSSVSEQSQDNEIICFTENLLGSIFEQRANTNMDFKIYPNPALEVLYMDTHKRT